MLLAILGKIFGEGLPRSQFDRLKALSLSKGRDGVKVNSWAGEYTRPGVGVGILANALFKRTLRTTGGILREMIHPI